MEVPMSDRDYAAETDHTMLVDAERGNLAWFDRRSDGSHDAMGIGMGDGEDDVRPVRDEFDVAYVELRHAVIDAHCRIDSWYVVKLTLDILRGDSDAAPSSEPMNDILRTADRLEESYGTEALQDAVFNLRSHVEHFVASELLPIGVDPDQEIDISIPEYDFDAGSDDYDVSQRPPVEETHILQGEVGVEKMDGWPIDHDSVRRYTLSLSSETKRKLRASLDRGHASTITEFWCDFYCQIARELKADDADEVPFDGDMVGYSVAATMADELGYAIDEAGFAYRQPLVDV
jgi:hypothetical protein